MWPSTLIERLSNVSPILFTVLLDVAVKGLAILSLTAFTTFAMRRASAAARHLVWFLGTASSLLLPILSAALPGWYVLPGWVMNEPAMTSPQRDTVPALPLAQYSGANDEVGTTNDEFLRPEQRARADVLLPVAPPSAPQDSPAASPLHLSWQGWVLLVWLGGSAVILGYVALGSLSLIWLERRSVEITGGSWAMLLRQLCGQLGIGRRVKLLSSSRRSMPMTWGLWFVRVLLPGDRSGWTSEQVRAVLLHELAHAKRWDCLTQLAAQLACAVYWFNPLVWLAWRQMQTERERACDDLVLSSGTKASAYAEQLLHIASQMPARRFSAAAIAMARPSKLEGRLLAILDVTRNRRSLTWGASLLAVLLIGAIAVPLAMVRAGEEKKDAGASLAATQPGATFRRFSNVKLLINNRRYSDTNGLTSSLNATGSAQCGHPGAVSDLSWRFIRTTSEGDLYVFVREFPADEQHPEHIETTTKDVTYTGKSLTVFEDDYQRIVIFPASPSTTRPVTAQASTQPARTATFTVTLQLAGIPDRQWKQLVKGDEWQRIEQPDGNVLILNAIEGKQMFLNPESKTATLSPLVNVSPEAAIMPVAKIEKSAEPGTNPVVSLGRKQIAGRDADGIRFTVGDGMVTRTVWRDTATGRLVRIELDADHLPAPAKQVHSVMSDIVFDVPLDDSLFAIQPPAGYKVRQGAGIKFQTIQLPTTDAATQPAATLNADQRLVLEWTDRQFASYFDARQFTGWPDQERETLEARCIDALKGPRDRGYYQSFGTLAALKSTKALPALRQIAFDRADKNNRDRWMSVRALGVIGDRQSIPDLIHLVYHGNINTRWWAQITLVRLTGQNFGKDWQAWGKWWNDSAGQPAFDPRIIRWWSGQPEPDKLAAVLEESDRKFLDSARGRVNPTTQAAAQPPSTASAPPHVVRTTPAIGQMDVDPALKELTIEFDRPMRQGGHSFVGGGPNFPGAGQRPRWRDDRTVVFPIKLEAGHGYWLSANYGRFRNFCAADGTPAADYPLTFATRPAPDGQLLSRPKVIRATPADGATVDAGISEIRVEFDQPMNQQAGYSWVRMGEDFPQTRGPSSWANDRVAVLPIAAEPGRQYRLSINSESFQNFQGANGLSAEPYPFAFGTNRAAGGK